MEKPITVARMEFSKNIMEVVNGANLPFFAIRQVLEELLSAVCQLEEAQAEKDLAEYERHLKKLIKESDRATNNAAPSEEEG